jgi:transposase
VVAAEQAREDIARARTEWRDGMMALDPERLVFIDDSGFDTRMARRCGRAARGVPCVGAVPHGHWRNTTFIAGLRSDRIDAPMLLEGAMDGDAFCAWIEQMLAPTLRPGDLVICDNLSVHKNARARAAIEACGAELRFLPAYSPDFNPIETAFAKLKALVRSAAARCADTRCTAIASALASALTAFTPQECASYLRHAGYAST